MILKMILTARSKLPRPVKERPSRGACSQSRTMIQRQAPNNGSFSHSHSIIPLLNNQLDFQAKIFSRR
jgi:hypothetical protein